MSINWAILKRKRQYIDDELKELDRALKEENADGALEAFANIEEHAFLAREELEDE